MKALTLRQPWAHLIVQGHKTIENRIWRTELRGDLVIHAAKQVDRSSWKKLRDEHGNELVPDLDQLATGAVVGVVALTGIHGATWPAKRHTPGCGVWGERQDHMWHWVLESALALPEPIPAAGKLSLWTPGDDLKAQIEAAAKEAQNR